MAKERKGGPQTSGSGGAEPSEASERRRLPPWTTVWRESRQLLWAHRRRLVLGFVLLVISRLAGMVLPATTKVLIDDVIGQGRTELLWWIAGGAGAATVVQAASSFALTILLGVAGQRAITDLRRRVQEHVARLPIEYFEEHKSGELISRIVNDAEGVRNLVGTGFVQLTGSFVTAGVAFAVLFWLNWKLTLITLVFLGVFGAMLFVGFSKLRPIFRERGKLMADLTGRLSESLGGAKIVKAYTAEKREERIFARSAHRLLRNIARSMVGMSTIGSLSRLLFGLVGIALSVAGARAVLAGEMTVGDIFMFVVFTGLLVSPLIQMSNIGTQITEAFAGLDRIRDVLAVDREDEDPRRTRRLPRVEGRVAFDRVTFEYTEGLPVLHDVSFDSPAGTTTALVGSSGAGKTTVISLVMGFRTPTSGRVLVDGVDLATVRLRDYRKHVAVVLQDDFLFDGTIGENIAYGEPGATAEQIAEAGRLARCDEFVGGFESGYDTIIGERGVKLSGGQRQRVSIARAMLANPRILILDEATSSLDSENEALIQEGLGTLKRGRTVFVIAHRLSTIRTADQILVMEDGRIVERGRHAELFAAGGRYRELHDRQHALIEDTYLNPGEEPETEREDGRPGPPPASRRSGALGGGLPTD